MKPSITRTILAALTLLFCSCSKASPDEAGGGAASQGPATVEVQGSLLDNLLAKRTDKEMIFVADCKDERYSDTPALRALCAQLTERGVTFKQPLYRQYVYYLNRLIPLLRQWGRVWLVYNDELPELTTILREGLLDQVTIAWQHKFAAGTLCLIENTFVEDSPSAYTFASAARRGAQTTNIAFAPDSQHMLVSGKTGRVRWFSTADKKRSGTALLLPPSKKGTAGIFSGSESGLVGMAFHPQAAANNRVFLHYNWQYEDGHRDAIISEWRYALGEGKEGPKLVDERPILKIPQPKDSHNAGMLLFGPDGMLYIAVGDGHDGKVRERSPAHNFRGKVLRINVDDQDEERAYAVPADNPFVGDDGFPPETWAWGFRNPWRLAFTPDGRMIAGDIGEDVNEELTFVVKGSHHGWPFFEGLHKRYDYEHASPLQPPLLPYGRTTGMSVVAGMIYEGLALPELQGKFIFADYLTGVVWSLDLPEDTQTTLSIEDAQPLIKWPLMLSTVTAGPDKELYFGAHDGDVVKLVRGTGEVAAVSALAGKAEPSVARGMFGNDFPGAPAPKATEQVRALGKRLFFHAGLSRDGKRSCATCHQPEKHGQNGVAKVVDSYGRKRNVPSIFNVNRQFAQFRDYREATVEGAVQESLVSHMGHSERGEAAKKLAADQDIVAAFERAMPGTSITAESIGLAVGAYLRSLGTSSRWEQFLDGDDDALTDAEMVGLNEFMLAGCTTCHLYRGLGGGMYQKLGLLKPWGGEDKGRGHVDPDAGQDQFFKVSSLFNVAETAPYYHDGSMASLADAVRNMSEIQLGRELSDAKVAAIVTFLESMSGDIPEDAR